MAAIFLIFVFVFQAIFISNVAHASDPFAVAKNPCSEIRNAQYVCIDCRTVGFCRQTSEGGGGWQTAVVGSCSGAYFFCNDEANGCTYSQQCELVYRGPKFVCQNPGIYPDPYDCKYYHECNARNELTTSVCSNGLGYSIQSRTCSLSKNSDECKVSQYKCEHAGQVGLWPSDNNIYYICLAQVADDQLILYPSLHRCPVGQIFVEYQCVSRVDTGTPPIAEQCRKGSLVADTTNCHAYHKCNEMQQLLCPSGTYFDDKKGSCVLGNC